jgi:CheY-like chemotaxis protein
VKSLDGELSVESEPGWGTTVHVWLPRSGALAADAPPAGTAPRCGAGEHVLLVDDDPGVLVATVRVLERLGYQVTALEDGAEALERYRADPGSFDVVLSDLSMPGLTGLQLAEEVDRMGAGTPVVLCTGYLDGLGRVGAEAAGVAGVLVKPFDLVVLAGTLRSALDGSAVAA